MNREGENRTISPQMVSPMVSIIMPVYNAQDTLAQSIASVLGQTYPSIELLLVDDASTDQSLSVMRQEEQKNSTSTKIIILPQSHNGGVAQARNIGLAHARGQYIYWVDADDTLDPRTIELLVKEAQHNAADIVGCGWYLAFSENKRRMPQSPFSSPREALQKLMSGVMRWNLWLFMVSRDLLIQHPEIRFEPQQNMGEDMMFMLKLFSVAKRVGFVNEPLYIYSQQNEHSLTRTYSEQHRHQVTHNVELVTRYLLQKSCQHDEIAEWIALLKLTIKLPLLFTGRKADFRIWRQWFPESNLFVLKNKMLPLRTKGIQWCASKGFFLPIKLYHTVVFKFVYGVLYK